MSIRIQSGAVLSAAIFGFVASSALLVSTTAWGQGIPGPSVNIIGPTPEVYNLVPDKGLKQQNEVHCAVRPDDPLIAFCGYNDYRTTELTDDAWVGASMTRDGGLTWMSRVVPGWPLYQGGAGPIGHDFAADPNTAAVPGLVLYNFIAADRGKKGTGGLFVQRWFESDQENGFPYVPSQDTILIAKGTSCPQCSGQFIDKPHMIATLNPESGRPPVDVWDTLEDGSTRNAKIPAGELHLVYSVFTGSKQDTSKILHTYSTDWGQTWSSESKITESVDINQSAHLVARGDELLVVWRRFDDNNETNALMYSMSRDRGQTWDKGEVLAELTCPYDQPTRNNMFRTTVHPVAATDGNKFYVFWSQRGEDPVLNSCDFGLARIVMMSSTDGVNWDTPVAVDNGFDVQGRGYQFMPSVTSANGVLQLAWYDTRDSLLQIHNEAVMDVLFPESDTLRYGLIGKHTADVRGMQIVNGVPVSASSIRISTYPMVQAPFLGPNKAMQVGHNLLGARMFAGGKVPFMGDYISVAARGSRLDDSGQWVNNQATGAAVPDTFYTAWTDNRDSRGDRWGDLSDIKTTTYTPSGTNIPPKATLDLEPGSEADPSYREWSCDAYGNTDRTRDQNVYAATVKPGASVSLPTPSKQLGALQRGFVVNVENTDRRDKKDFTICIDGQPDDYVAGSTESTGLASFSQFPAPIGLFGLGTAIAPVTTLQISVPPQSNSAQSVYVTSLTDNFPRIPVKAYSGTFDCSSDTRGTLLSTVVINGNQLARPVLDPNADPIVACEPDTIDISTGELCKPTDGSSVPIAEYEVHTPEIINYIWSLYHIDAESSGPYELNSAFLEALVMNPLIMTKDPYGNPLIMTRDITNPLIMTRDGGTNPLIMTRDDTTNPLIMTRDDTTNPLIMTRGDVTNPLIMTRDGDPTNPLIMTKDGTTNPLVMTRDDTANPLVMTRDDPTNPLIMTRDGTGAPLIMTRDETGNPLVMTREQYNNPLVMTRDGDGTRVMLPGDTFLTTGGTYDFPKGYVEVTWLVENEGNTITAYNAMPQVPGDSLVDAEGKQIPSQLIVTKPYLTYASRDCVPGMQVQNQILLNSMNPFTKNMVEQKDENGDPVLDEDGNPVLVWDGTYRVDPGKATFFSGPGEEATVTLRVFDPTFNPSRLGFSVQSQSCDSDELNCVIEPLAEILADLTAPTDPVITGSPPSPIDFLPAAGPGGTFAQWLASSTDEGGSVDLSCVATFEGQDVEVFVDTGTGAFSALFPIGVLNEDETYTATSVTCTATDEAGNTSSSNFEVLVLDVDPPILTSTVVDETPEATSAEGAVVTFSLEATDFGVGFTLKPETTSCSAVNTDDSSLTIDSLTSGDTVPLGSWLVTCVGQDIYGNVGSTSFTVTITDITAPSFDLTGVSDRTEEATGAYTSLADLVLPTASDLVDGPVAVSCDVPSGGFPVGTTVVNCSTADGRTPPNTAQTSFSVTITDNTAPVLTPVTNISLEATAALTPISYTTTASDLVDGSLPVSCLPAEMSYAVGTRTVTCSATDTAQNTGSTSFSVTITDSTAPVVAAVANISLEATGAQTTVSYSTTASDLVDGDNLAATCSPVSGSGFGVGTTPVTCSTTDTAENTGSTSFDVIITDSTAPVVAAVANISLEATGALTTVSYSTTASDLVDGDNLAATCSPVSGSGFGVGTTPVTCSTTDTAENTGSTSFSVIITDSTAPVVAAVANISLEATGALTTASYSTTASDLVDGVVVVTCDPVSGTGFAVGTTSVACSATDAIGNIGSTSFDVIITDSTAPIVAAVSNISLEATGAQTTVTYSTTASDLVDGVVTVTCDPVSGTGFAVGTTSVTCSATDAIGNIGSTSFDVIITDSTAPIVAAVSNISLEATGAQTTVTYSTTASDLVDGAVAVTCDPVSGTGFAVGTTSVTCSATDTIGNTGSTSFNVIVNDGTPPSLSTVANITTEATGAGTTVTFALPAAIDLVNGALVASCSPASGTDFIVGTTVVNCSASDSNGNTGTSSFTVMVEDTTAPSVKAVDDITVEAIGPTTGVEYLTSALDLVDGTMATSCLPISGSAFDVGTTPVTCSATDANFNTGSTSFNVIVTDTTAPVVDEQADITAYADSPAGATVEYTVGATDLVDGAVSTSCSPASPNTFAMGETTVTCTATDGSGNEGTGSFAVKVYYGSFIGMDVPNGMSIEGGDGDTRLDLGETAVGSYSRSIPLYWQYGDTTGASMDSGSADPTAHIDRFSTLEDGSCDFLSDPIDAGDSGNSGMRYTSSSQSWKYSWKPANGPGCYGITIESGLTGQENGPYLFELR